ncbi:CYC02 protein-like isoform X4 [Coffea eugenioides]|uniref:CYC02 protein-like isoform X4 n=1 Tax=Coffea eugenioides TaxID=49369 RepID=UPI000F5D3777|nr:CYC02 protein-like isoform X2 [Coffea arabica]XP_027165418.1 CYC02 protein-like isoform X4 [Coffea eugenioides]
MASSKNLLFLFVVLFALALQIPSDVTAADQASVKTTGEAHQDKISEDRCRYRCCSWYHGQCQRCCASPEETPEATSGDKAAVNADRCRYRCCSWYHGQCQRCCASAEETPEAISADRCRYRCCRWYHGQCQRCCATAEETPEATSGDEVKN